MKSINLESRTKICVIFPGALGDFICFLPVLQTLARAARVDLFARSEFAELAPERCEGSDPRAFPNHSFVPSGVGLRTRRRNESFRGYDAVYSWFASGNHGVRPAIASDDRRRSACLSISSGSRWKVTRQTIISAVSHHGVDSAGPAVTIRPEALRWCEEFWAQTRAPPPASTDDCAR